MIVTACSQACGATVSGVELSRPLNVDSAEQIRQALLEHQVLVFPDQRLEPPDLERLASELGEIYQDPFIAPMPGYRHALAVHRLADEQGPVFAEGWHSDWSFEAHPPALTCLYAVRIPPQGGDTLFANQQQALADMPSELRAQIDGRRATHSAALAFGPNGLYRRSASDSLTGMAVRTSTRALACQAHDLVRKHPESGVPGLFGALGYITGIEGLPRRKSVPLLGKLLRWQTQDRFVYRHRWQPRMLVIWDNRALIHRATGGYAGHERLMHRLSVA